MSIVFSDDEDKSYCDSCDYILIERKDGSMICSNCCREYLPDSVKKHKAQLQPNKSRYERDGDGPLLVSMTSYTEKQKKKPSVFDREDRHFRSQKSGLSIVTEEEYLPDK